jgi:hypothetical protein
MCEQSPRLYLPLGSRNRPSAVFPALHDSDARRKEFKDLCKPVLEIAENSVTVFVLAFVLP